MSGNQVVVISRTDGGVSIMSINGELTDDAIDIELQKWRDNSPGQYVSHRLMDASAIPADRTWREAWADVSDEPVIDIPLERAREVRKAALRAERAPLLAALDVQFMRAVETGDPAEQARIAAKKQALRDVTSSPAFAAARSLDDLALIALPD